MALHLTAVFRKVPEGYVGFVEELPGANAQGATLAETRENLQEAAELILDANRLLAVSARYVVHPELSEKNGVATHPFGSEETPDEASS